MFTPERRFRGEGKHPLWKRLEEVSVIVLPLIVPGAHEEKWLEKLFDAMFSLRRALQNDVRDRLRAYWAGGGSRTRGHGGGSWV